MGRRTVTGMGDVPPRALLYIDRRLLWTVENQPRPHIPFAQLDSLCNFVPHFPSFTRAFDLSEKRSQENLRQSCWRASSCLATHQYRVQLVRALVDTAVS